MATLSGARVSTQEAGAGVEVQIIGARFKRHSERALRLGWSEVS